MKNKLRSLGNRLFRLFFPPIPLLLFLILLSAAALVYAFVIAKGEGILAYLAYFLSAYTLTASVCQAPALIQKVKRFKEKNPLYLRYASDPALRVRASLVTGLALNLAYTLFQTVLGIYHRSLWFSAFAGYYALLSLMRFFLLRRMKTRSTPPDTLSEYRYYRSTGILLALMTLTLGGIVGYALTGEPSVHHPITVIGMAAFTFTSLTLAITSAVRYKKYQSPLFSAAKALSLATASVSMLTLESAMLTAFGDQSAAFSKGMLAATGIALLLFVLSLSVYMTVKAQKRIHPQTHRNHDHYGNQSE